MTTATSAIRIPHVHDLPTPPDPLQRSGRRLWDKVVRKYELDDIDLELLLVACQALDDAMHHRKKAKAHGTTPKDRFGQRKLHPSEPEKRACWDTVRCYLRELALMTQAPDSRPPTPPRGYVS